MATTVVFVDSRLPGARALIDALAPGAVGFLVDAADDGLARIAQAVAPMSGIDAVHIVCHGEAGALRLGAAPIDAAALAGHGADLAALRTALAPGADLLLTACDVARGAQGLAFVESLAAATGADVAASDARVGGDGDLVTLNTTTGPLQSTPLALPASLGTLGENTAPTFLARDATTVDYTFYGARPVLATPDGRIVVAGAGYQSVGALRYNADGSPDTSFDRDGVASTTFDKAVAVWAAALQSDGKLLVAGDYGTRALVVRYRADGRPDAAFDADGIVSTDLGTGTTASARALALQADGRVVVAGTVHGANAQATDFFVARYLADGSLDASFGTNGVVVTDVGKLDPLAGGAASDSASGVVVQADGRIVVTGTSDGRFALARYTASGALDASYGGNGVATAQMSNGTDVAAGAVLQPDGRVVVAGATTDHAGDQRFAVARFDALGNLDASFGTGGRATTGFGFFASAGTSVALQPDGAIVVAGVDRNLSGTGNFALARFAADGSLDPNFSGDGMVTTDFGASDVAYGVAALADGRLLAAGNDGQRTLLARYDSHGTLDTFSTLDTVSRTVEAPYPQTGTYAVTLDASVQVRDAELATRNNYAGATLVVARSGGANADDVFSADPDRGVSALVAGANFSVDGVIAGRVVANGGGRLELEFGAGASQGRVDAVLSSIAYRNAAGNLPDTVRLDWTFGDGNTGLQGDGGALSTTGQLTVLITRTSGGPNLGPPVVNIPLADQVFTAGQTKTVAIAPASFTDPDPGVLGYSVALADGTAAPAWLSFDSTTLTFTGSPPPGTIGVWDVAVTARDSGGLTATDDFLLTVTAVDTVAPAILSSFPSDGASGVPVNASIVVAFSEPIQRGNGAIEIHSGSPAGALVERFDAATSPRLSVAGASLTIDPSVDLLPNSAYALVFTAASVRDVAGNAFPGTSNFDFTTGTSVAPDTAAPVLRSTQPTDDALEVATDAAIVLTFDEAIARGTGSVVLRKGTGDVVETFPAGGSADLVVSGSTVTIRPSAALATGTDYVVDFGFASFTDTAGNPWAGSASYNFRTAGPRAGSLLGTAGDDVLAGTGFADFVSALAGNDLIAGLGGNDDLDGGPGRDVALFGAARAGYRVEKTGTLWKVTDTAGGEGTDTLHAIEALQFADKSFELAGPGLAHAPDYGRDPSFLFDPVYYLLANPDLVPSVTLAGAWTHYASIGASVHRKPVAWFDASYYAAKWADLAPLHLDDATLFMHYNLYGVWEGRSAGPRFDHFDGNRYLADNPDVAAYVDANLAGFLGSRTNGAIAHFIIYGANEQRVAYDTTGVLVDMGYVV